MTESVNGSKGGRPREYSDEAFLDAVEAHADETGVRTGKIADVVGCEPRQALNRLTELEEAGEIESIDVTSRMKLWRLAE